MHRDKTTPHRPPDKYRGRFAPSPTGPLHFGSLVTALGSYLQARSLGGEWLLRIEDIDPPREQAGAADIILQALDAYQLHWDGPVTYQSQRGDLYEAALTQLKHQGSTFPCSCSRSTIKRNRAKAQKTQTLPSASNNAEISHQAIYPGTCRTGLSPGTTTRAIRLRISAHNESGVVIANGVVDKFIDGLQGQQITSLTTEVGDFIVRRSDGLYAYHLAVVVDDAEQGITEVVRGTDLLASTAPQRYLQKSLGYSHPNYCHLPIATNRSGQKLSKQAFARPIEGQNCGPTLLKALAFLGQCPDADLIGASPGVIMAWAVENWTFNKIPKRNALYSGFTPASH